MNYSDFVKASIFIVACGVVFGCAVEDKDEVVDTDVEDTDVSSPVDTDVEDTDVSPPVDTDTDDSDVGPVDTGTDSDVEP